MENALYYTLSTIAQTLAGALAVLVAFVVFWRSNVDSDIRQARSFLSKEFGLGYREVDSLLAAVCEKGEQGFNDFLRARGPQMQSSATLPYGEILAAAHEGHQKRVRVTRRLYVTLAVSTAAIALCFAVLPFTPLLSRQGPAAGLLLSAAAALGLVCLVLYLQLIRALVGA